MKHSLLAITAFLVPFSLSAAPAVPKVSCDLFWDLRDASGVTVKNSSAKTVSVVLNKEADASIKDFSLNAHLRSGGAAGGPIGWYELTISLKNGEHKASRTDVAKPYRQSLTLEAGRERAFVNCDIN